MDLIRHGPCARMTHTVAHMAQEKGVTAIVAFAFCPFLGFALTNVIEHLVLLFPPISMPSPPKRCGRISARTPLCKSYGFCSQKRQVPFRNFHSPWRFWKRRHFHGELGDKGRLTWNILQLIVLYPTKRREFGNPKLKESNFP